MVTPTCACTCLVIMSCQLVLCPCIVSRNGVLFAPNPTELHHWTRNPIPQQLSDRSLEEALSSCDHRDIRRERTRATAHSLPLARASLHSFVRLTAQSKRRPGTDKLLAYPPTWSSPSRDKRLGERPDKFRLGYAGGRHHGSNHVADPWDKARVDEDHDLAAANRE